MVDYVFERHLSGGILLPANKTASTSAPIHRGFIPSQLVLAVQQHRGAAAEVAVRIGERVLKGQIVARAAAHGPSAAAGKPLLAIHEHEHERDRTAVEHRRDGQPRAE
jgi:hypothetical protein